MSSSLDSWAVKRKEWQEKISAHANEMRSIASEAKAFKHRAWSARGAPPPTRGPSSISGAFLSIVEKDKEKAPLDVLEKGPRLGGRIEEEPSTTITSSNRTSNRNGDIKEKRISMKFETGSLPLAMSPAAAAELEIAGIN